MIKSSLEWTARRDELNSRIQTLHYNAELRKMLHNIDSMVISLSRREVDLRRQHRSGETSEELKKVNSAIETLEQWIIMAALLR